MSVKMTACRSAYTDEFGEHKEFQSEWEPQIHIHDYCFAVIKRGRRYVVREHRVYSFWFTNIWGWQMENGWCYAADDYGETLFRYEDKQKAIEVCEQKNRMRKVKVIYLA